VQESFPSVKFTGGMYDFLNTSQILCSSNNILDYASGLEEAKKAKDDGDEPTKL